MSKMRICAIVAAVCVIAAVRAEAEAEAGADARVKFKRLIPKPAVPKPPKAQKPPSFSRRKTSNRNSNSNIDVNSHRRTTSNRNVEWPVFFEKLGHVHSIHNKFDLALRVHINVPAVEQRIGKVIKKLKILGTDIKDPAFKRRFGTAATSPPKKLQDLDLSWSEQNRRIRLRCENIERRAKDLRELGDHRMKRRIRRRRSATDADNQEADNIREYLYDSPVPQRQRTLSRRKRQDLFGGGGFLKDIFGIAYTTDVHGLNGRIAEAESRLNIQLNGVRTMASSIKDQSEVMSSRQEDMLKAYDRKARVLEKKVNTMETNPFMRTSISDLVHVRNEAYKGLALEVDLIEERLMEVETIVTSLGSGKLSKSVIAPHKLRETLVSIEKQLPENFSLLFNSKEAMWQYYSAIGASAAFDDRLEDVVVTVSIPLVDKTNIMSLDRVHNLPLKVKDGYSVVADISTEYLVTDSTQQYFLELYKDDFQDCQVFNHEGSQQFYCGLDPMLRADRARSCVMQLYQGQSDPAWCQSRLKHGLVQPYTRLYNGSWVFSALQEQISVMLECPDGRQPTALVGFGVISLKEGCTITSREFHYPHTFRGIVEISISSGSFTREVDQMSERSDSEYDDLYNLNNFKDDILFKEYSTMDGDDDDDNDLFGDESGLGFGVDDFDDTETSTRSSTSRSFSSTSDKSTTASSTTQVVKDDDKEDSTESKKDKKDSKTPRQEDILDKEFLNLFSNLRDSLPKLTGRLPSISELSNRVSRMLNHDAPEVTRE